MQRWRDWGYSSRLGGIKQQINSVTRQDVERPSERKSQVLMASYLLLAPPLDRRCRYITVFMSETRSDSGVTGCVAFKLRGK